MALLDELLVCERAVWEALVSGDAQADAAALARDFLGVYPDGFAGREAHAGQLENGPTVARYVLSEARVLSLGDGYALLAYRAAYTRVGRDAPEEMAEEMPEEMYVSSIWRRTAEGWENLFSQDTPATGQAVP